VPRSDFSQGAGASSRWPSNVDPHAVTIVHHDRHLKSLEVSSQLSFLQACEARISDEYRQVFFILAASPCKWPKPCDLWTWLALDGSQRMYAGGKWHTIIRQSQPIELDQRSQTRRDI